MLPKKCTHEFGVTQGVGCVQLVQIADPLGTLLPGNLPRVVKEVAEAGCHHGLSCLQSFPPLTVWTAPSGRMTFRKNTTESCSLKSVFFRQQTQTSFIRFNCLFQSVENSGNHFGPSPHSWDWNFTIMRNSISQNPAKKGVNHISPGW